MFSVHTLISVFKKLNTALFLKREQIENIKGVKCVSRKIM